MAGMQANLTSLLGPTSGGIRMELYNDSTLYGTRYLQSLRGGVFNCNSWNSGVATTGAVPQPDGLETTPVFGS